VPLEKNIVSFDLRQEFQPPYVWDQMWWQKNIKGVHNLNLNFVKKNNNNLNLNTWIKSDDKKYLEDKKLNKWFRATKNKIWNFLCQPKTYWT